MAFRRIPRLALLLLGFLAVAGCVSPPASYVLKHAQAPVDTIRVWAYRWPSPVSGPEVDLTKVIAEFEGVNPGIKVEVSTFGYQACIQEVTKALDAGAPPDVYLPPPGGLAWYSGNLQVDLTEHISARGTAAYLPQGIEACRIQGKLLALPTWVEGRAWLCNGSITRLATFDTAKTLGWTWGEFEDLCLRLKDKGVCPAIVDPSSPEMMADLGYTPPRVPGPPPAVILAAPPAEMSRLLARRGLAETTFVGFPERRSIEAFGQGKTGFMAGISPTLASEILTMGEPKRGFSPVLVPVPSTGVAGSPLRAGGAIVFKRPPQADAHTRLAVSLAAAISRSPSPDGFPALLAPAYRPNLGGWTVRHGWNAVVALQSVHKGNSSPLTGVAEIGTSRDSREKLRRDVKRGFTAR